MRSALLAAALLAAAAPARAGEDARRAEAKALATKGDDAFYAGHCDKAVPLWREAEAAFHAPTILLRIARCQAALGHVVDASETLDRVIGEPLGAGAPPAFAIAQEQARRDLPAVRARVATLDLRVSARRDRGPVVVEIDGLARPSGATEHPLDPGDHTLRVRAGASSFQTSLRLREGERRALTVALSAEPDRPRLARTLGVTSLGMGSVAVATGAAFAVAAAAARGARDDHAPTYTTVSSAAFAGGAVLAAAGALALAAAPPRDGDAWRVQVVASPVSIGLRGRF